MPLVILAGTLALIGAGVFVLLWQHRARHRDRVLLRQMEPLMEELWRPLRFLTDLRKTWPGLTDKQRAEIEASVPYKVRFHERRVDEYAGRVRELSRRLRSWRHWRLRARMIEFLDAHGSKEPDELKVLIVMVRKNAGY
jgi:hypothetical protein